MRLLTPELKKHLPELGSNRETPLELMTVYARFLDRSGSWRWYPMEFDGKGKFMGLVVAGSFAVLGEFTLSELESIRADRDREAEGVLPDPEFHPLAVGELARLEPAVLHLLEEASPPLVKLEGMN